MIRIASDQLLRRLNMHGVFEWSPSDRVHFALDGMLDNYTLESNATVLSLYQAVSPPDIQNIVLAPNGTVRSANSCNNSRYPGPCA